MNVHARRRKVRIGVALIAEVLADVLQEAKDNGEGGLTIADVNERTGCSETDLHYELCRGVLQHMKRVGDAVNDQPGLGDSSWRLTG